MIENIEKLDSLDQIGIIKIIHECEENKPYFVTNRQTMMDLDNLNNRCLRRISYHVNLCLENMIREKDKIQAAKQHLERLTELDDDLKRKSKLKLTHVNIKEEEDTDESVTESEDEEETVVVATETRPEIESDVEEAEELIEPTYDSNEE